MGARRLRGRARGGRARIAICTVLLLGASCTKQAADPAPPRPTEPPPVPAPPAHEAPPPADAGPAATAVDAAASPAEAPIRVKVVTIGMHVGGGPYDEITKEPIRRSVEPHFAELARCWKHVPQPHQADVGVDLVIEAAGGRAKVSNPRKTIEAGEAFIPCIVAFYEGVDFQRPKSGKTVVSYSVRFLP
jgi:hypothetical protein